MHYATKPLRYRDDEAASSSQMSLWDLITYVYRYWLGIQAVHWHVTAMLLWLPSFPSSPTTGILDSPIPLPAHQDTAGDVAVILREASMMLDKTLHKG